MQRTLCQGQHLPIPALSYQSTYKSVIKRTTCPKKRRCMLGAKVTHKKLARKMGLPIEHTVLRPRYSPRIPPKMQVKIVANTWRLAGEKNKSISNLLMDEKWYTKPWNFFICETKPSLFGAFLQLKSFNMIIKWSLKSKCRHHILALAEVPFGKATHLKFKWKEHIVSTDIMQRITADSPFNETTSGLNNQYVDNIFSKRFKPTSGLPLESPLHRTRCQLPWTGWVKILP